MKINRLSGFSLLRQSIPIPIYKINIKFFRTKYYRFMVIAVKILERALRDDFGWKHLLWVFSGRRGIHCWICDESARKLSPSERGAVIDYLAVLSVGESKRYNVNHPFVKLVAINTIIKFYTYNFYYLY